MGMLEVAIPALQDGIERRNPRTRWIGRDCEAYARISAARSIPARLYLA